MKVFAISDLHLSGLKEKPMNIFGEVWEGHFEKIIADWREKVVPEDIVLIGGDTSWGMKLEEGMHDVARLAPLPGKKVFIENDANAAAYGAGVASGYGVPGTSWVLPSAGVISGIAGVVQAMAPYMGVFGLGATVAGNLLQGTTSAALAAYQNVSNQIVANADSILSNKVRNIETVVKMLDTQGDIVKKMLKDSIEGDSKQVQNM